MAVNMSDSYGPPSDYEPYSHYAFQASSQLDFTFYSPPHDGTSKDSPVPAVVFNATLSEDMPSLGLTGDGGDEDANLDDLLPLDDTATPRKRDRGERIVWTPEEDEYLRKAVQIYGDKTEKWAKIAACVPGRTNKNCRKRWFHSLDPKLKKGPWTEDEDHLLRTGVEMFKGQWSKIAERIPGRTDDQCAKRWREGLDPHIDRAAWTPEDDMVLLQRFEEFGSQWQKIALAFPGRPGLHCRNRWRKIQRSLNHMKRANKRRSQGTATDHASIISETRRLEALLDSHNDDLESEGAHYTTAEDMLLMQDAFLDDDFALEHGIVLDEDDLASVMDAMRGDLPEASDVEDQPYGCAVPECSFMSSSPSLLYYHIKASHSGTKVEKPFRCTMPGCETRKRYKNINGLQYHVTHAKNSPGHSGQSGLSSNSGPSGQTHPADDGHAGESSIKAARTARQSTPNSHSRLNTQHSNAPSPGREFHIPMPSTSFDPSKMTLSNPPTPAEIQLQLHQTKQDLSPPQPIMHHLSHNAFNIPHSTTPLEGSAASSQTSSGASSPQIQRTVFRCPELGCDQSYHQIHGLNAHMANSHGHRAMTMRSNDAMYGPEAMMIPQEDHHTDFDMDMTDLASGSPSPMDTNIMLLEGSLLQHQLDGTDHTGMDTSPSPGAPQEGVGSISNGGSGVTINTANMGSGTFGTHHGNEYLFTSHITNTLQNRMHFGTHITVTMHEPVLIQPVPILPALPTDNMSLTMSAGIVTSAPSTPPSSASSSRLVKSSAGGRSGATKRLACSGANCQKSYASATTLNNHLRNDHPDLFTNNGTVNAISSTSSLRTIASAPASTFVSTSFSAQRLLTMDTMEVSHSPDHASREGEENIVMDKSEKPEKPEKPYKCLVPGCGKGYTNINGLKNHLLQTHGSTPKTSTAA